MEIHKKSIYGFKKIYVYILCKQKICVYNVCMDFHINFRTESFTPEIKFYFSEYIYFTINAFIAKVNRIHTQKNFCWNSNPEFKSEIQIPESGIRNSKEIKSGSTRPERCLYIYIYIYIGAYVYNIFNMHSCISNEIYIHIHIYIYYI